jgi:hypothetical protein
MLGPTFLKTIDRAAQESHRQQYLSILCNAVSQNVHAEIASLALCLRNPDKGTAS